MRVSRQFYFLSEKILHALEKYKKHTKHKKLEKRTSDFRSVVFHTHEKHKKHKASNK